jgi:two-component system, NarL family, sensor histidine kinase DesK
VSTAPADVVLSTLRGARVAVFALQAPAAAFLLLNSSTPLLGSITSDVRWLPLALAVIGLQGFLVLSAVHRRTPSWAGLVWLAIVACAAVLVVGNGPALLPVLWFVAAAGAFALPRRLGSLVLVATIVVFVGLAATVDTTCQCWRAPLEVVTASGVLNYTVTGVAGAIGPFMAARLLGVVDDLARTRAELALTTAEEERRRLSRDLHDALGQGLSAVALKGDLALALLEQDPVAAQREIDSLTEVAQRLRTELPGIVAAGQPASFAVEAGRAERLLREAGVDVRRRGELGALPAAVDSALGWVVREAATNVLRHSDAQQWMVLAGRDEHRVWLEMINDLPQVDTGRPGPDRPGTGLVGMAERLRTVGGRLRAHGDSGQFMLRVEVAT